LAAAVPSPTASGGGTMRPGGAMRPDGAMRPGGAMRLSSSGCISSTLSTTGEEVFFRLATASPRVTPVRSTPFTLSRMSPEEEEEEDEEEDEEEEEEGSD